MNADRVDKPGTTGPGKSPPRNDAAGLASRAAGLRQAARLPRAQPELLLDAALAELDAAVAALDRADDLADTGSDGQPNAGVHADRRLLHAIFTATPLPLYVVDGDGTVLRANAAAGELIGAGPGYATGRSLATLIEPAARAALRSKLAAALRTGASGRVSCGMLGSDGVVPSELLIEPLAVRGDADRLLVAVARDPSRSGKAQRRTASKAAADNATMAAGVRRLDLLAEAARLLLEATTVSESVLLQRSARLLSDALATWAIVDLRRRGELRRHYVAGPDDPESADLAQVAAALNPTPGSVPNQVAESGQPLLLSHVSDELALGATSDGLPLLTVLDAASLLSVPMTDGSASHGVLTLIRRISDGQFGIADAALAEEIGGLLGRAITARRALRQRTETADALRASLLPPVLKSVPGVEIASAHLAPTRGREVGGDFYDVYPTPGGWGIAIGDVCGKGEDGAAATAAARHAIRVLAHSDPDPASVLRGANEIMLAEEFGGRFVTATAAHLSWRDGALHLVLASAGHPGPVLIAPDGRTQLLPGGGVPLGIFADPESASRELQLSAGDILFFYSDGLTDARSPQATYLEDSLADSLAELAGRRAADVVSDMRKLVLDFSDGILHDDLTMLALRAGTRPAT
ncbi:MAG TPA: SpoIIE family protein phosphatase [Streptosporangiaceae bacterium]|nr:SpoIIE family protein phosphatase [Streptosporangiaceae bacterium]